MYCQYHLESKNRNRCGGIIFTVCTILLFLAFLLLIGTLLVGGSHRVHQAYLDEQENSVRTEKSRSVHLSGASAANAQLWDRLTAARINLDDEPETKPSGEAVAEDRPAWVDKPPKRVGEVYRAVVASDPFSTADECFEQLEKRFPTEVQKRLAKLVSTAERSLVGSMSLESMGVSLDYIMREICREQYTEVLESSVGAMRRVYVLMEFTPAIESHLIESWQNGRRRGRLVSVAQVAGCVLASLALLYGTLQFDTWTRGYYTRRLLWGVPAAIIAVAAVFFFVA